MKDHNVLWHLTDAEYDMTQYECIKLFLHFMDTNCHGLQVCFHSFLPCKTHSPYLSVIQPLYNVMMLMYDPQNTYEHVKGSY